MRNSGGAYRNVSCFVHFANIEMPGYRQLHAGQQVRFTFERPGFLQDGCPYRARAVWPDE